MPRGGSDLAFTIGVSCFCNTASRGLPQILEHVEGSGDMLNSAILLALLLAATAAGQTDRTITSSPKGATMTARGTFEVEITPAAADGTAGGPFSRLFLSKQFHGDLEAASVGQMLGAETRVPGSGGYVALEQVTGTLHGKRGSFVLQHQGTMKGGTFVMHVAVVPDSGTDNLTGLAGTMQVVIEGSKHSYEFEYTLGGS